ncbi:MAG: ester cyclase [Candidatus Ventricola sp.]
MTNVQIVAHFFQDGYERKNYELVRSYLSEDYMDHSPAGARGSAQAVEILKLVASQLSELTIDLLDLFADGDRVAARVRFEGVHTGAMMGIPATGKRISFEALEHFRVVNGKIVESWGYWPDREIEEKLRSI